MVEHIVGLLNFVILQKIFDLPVKGYEVELVDVDSVGEEKVVASVGDAFGIFDWDFLQFF